MHRAAAIICGHDDGIARKTDMEGHADHSAEKHDIRYLVVHNVFESGFGPHEEVDTCLRFAQTATAHSAGTPDSVVASSAVASTGAGAGAGAGEKDTLRGVHSLLHASFDAPPLPRHRPASPAPPGPTTRAPDRLTFAVAPSDNGVASEGAVLCALRCMILEQLTPKVKLR